MLFSNEIFRSLHLNQLDKLSRFRILQELVFFDGKWKLEYYRLKYYRLDLFFEPNICVEINTSLTGEIKAWKVYQGNETIQLHYVSPRRASYGCKILMDLETPAQLQAEKRTIREILDTIEHGN